MIAKIRNAFAAALLVVGLGVPYLHAADTAISALSAGTTLAGTEAIPMVQSAATVKTTPAAIKTYIETGGTVTSSDPVLDLTQTWNDGAVTFTGLKFNATNTASAAASMLADFQVGGTSMVSLRKDGMVTVPTGGSTSSVKYAFGGATTGLWYNGNGALVFSHNGGDVAMLGEGGGSNIQVSSTGYFGWGHSGAPTLTLYRDANDVFAQRRTTNAQAFRVYDTYTDSSNYGRAMINTSLTGDWVQFGAETAGTGGDNYGVALTPTGTGAISAHVPDSATSGGNARGANAVDFQSASRSAATQVASGSRSGILSGQFNTASGALSGILAGYQNTASGQSSAVLSGEQNTASGAYAAVLTGYNSTAGGDFSAVLAGHGCTTRGLKGAVARCPQYISVVGDAQIIEQGVRLTTSNATPTSMAFDGTPAATTIMVLPAESVSTCVAEVAAINTIAGVVSMGGFTATAVVKNDSSTITVTGGTCTTIGTLDAALTGATCALVANGTLDGIEVQATGVAATTIRWSANLRCTQIL